MVDARRVRVSNGDEGTARCTDSQLSATRFLG